MNRLQVVRFRSLEKPKEDEFSLKLSKVRNYDDVVERVANHLGLDDPSKIRLTSHNCYSQQPKPQPINYRGVEHLSDMLVHYNQISDILYYEILDIPLPELQGLKTLKVAFHLSSKDEVINHTIRLPKQSTVGDVLNELKTMVELSHPKVELRLLEIFYHKINKIFPIDEKIENINDQFWTLRAEEIPEEEKKLGPHDRLIHAHHFKVDAAQNQGEPRSSTSVQNFGEPFFLVVRDGETLAEVKVRIQKRLQVPDEEFSKWKFAVLSLVRREYLLDSDIICNRVQKRDVVGVWKQYLGLEHSDTVPKRLKEGNQLYQNVPKKSYAANQAAKHVPSEPTQFVNASNRDSNSATPPPAGKVRFLSYWVSSEASLLLEKIHGLHKDTFVKFSVTSRFMQTGVLESFALFVESMLTTKVNEVNEEAICQAFISVKEFEQVGLDLSWLKRRLEEAELVNKLSDSRIFVESCETSLKWARAKVHELKEVLARAKEEVELMSRESPESLGVNDPVLEGVL
ncbi:ubiquitin C-terminal hydrolase 13-like isoform X1 [Rhododendron vialii]|uniref:ubiquitin C-terminal hydrolase 13-like isoform X1 n=1 Tax=Rhododendron vialii TaxID=182163 RepID=UPI00265FCD12|nr:ubiquitin C-terminal hydrolase 13-like isoform X1 [Rhododendron vialii]